MEAYEKRDVRLTISRIKSFTYYDQKVNNFSRLCRTETASVVSKLYLHVLLDIRSNR